MATLKPALQIATYWWEAGTACSWAVQGVVSVYTGACL